LPIPIQFSKKECIANGNTSAVVYHDIYVT
jgi:hypothetical protein